MWRGVIVAGLRGLGVVSSARALEPQAIVGDWVGEWNNGLGVRDAVYLTVTQVRGDRVEGTVYWRAPPGTAGGNRDLPFVGTRVGRTLSVRGGAPVPGDAALMLSLGRKPGRRRKDG